MIRRHKEIILHFWIPFGVIVCITALLFLPFLTKGHIPIPAAYMVAWYEPWKTETAIDGVPTIVHKPVVDDAFRHLYPLRVLASTLMKHGQWPLWNPYNASGTPLLGIMHPGYLTPLGIFFLVLPPDIAWGWYIMLQLVILGLSVYWYGRILTLSVRGSLLSAVTLMLSGFAVVRLEYGEFLYVLSGLPLLLGFVELRNHTSNHKGIYGIPLITALVMLSGQPHMIVYTLAVFALYTLVRLPLVDTLRVGGLALLGLGLSAVQLVPSLELFSLSTISRETSSFIFERFLLPATHLITVIIPNYFGNQATYNYFGPHDYVETIAYIGSIPVFLAAIAVWKRWKEMPVRFFAILGVVSMLTTVQWIGARFFFALPIPVLSADVPSRIFVLLTFSISLLAGIGVSQWERLVPNQRQKALVVMGVVLGALFFITYSVYTQHVPCPSAQVPQCRMVSVRTTGIELLVFAAFAFCGLIYIRVGGKFRSVLSWAPVALVVIIGFYNGQKFLPFSAPDMVFPKTPMIAALQKETGLGRYAGLAGAHIRANMMTGFDISGTEYFDPLNVKRYAELVSYVNHGNKRSGITRSDITVVSDATVSAELEFRRQRFWDMTGTAVMLMKRSDASRITDDILWEDANWQMARRPTAYPRAYMAQNIVAEPDDDRLLAKLFASETDLTNTALVEVPIEGIQGSGTEKGNVEIVEYSGNKVVLSAHVSGTTSLVVLSDTYYPGWHAHVDGVERTVYRVNYAFRGVVVPEGDHRIVFSYSPRSFIWGGILSLISLFFWGAGAYIIIRYHKG